MLHEDGRKLTPYLSGAGAFSLALGTSIGWGSLVVTSNTYLAQAGPAGSLLGLVAGALIMLIISRSYHYMMNSIPDAGGVYAYAKETYGYDHGFISSWFLALTYVAMFWANATALPLFAENFLGEMFHFGLHYRVFGYEMYFGEALLSVAAILLSALFCSHYRKRTARIMVILCGIFTACILFVFCVSMARGGASTPLFLPAFAPDSPPFAQFLRIVCISPWAFIGFESISHSAEEFRFNRKKVFGILCAAVVVALLLYTTLILLSVSARPERFESWADYISQLGALEGDESLPAFYAAGRYMGRAGIVLLVVALFALILTSLIGNLTALSRLLYAMGKDEVASSRFAKLNAHHIPDQAIWFVALCSLPIPFLGRAAIGWIVDVTTIGATIIFGFVSASAFKMARSRGERREMAAGLAGLILMVGFALYLLLFNLLSSDALQAETYFLFTVWAVFGFLFFISLLRRDYAKKFGKSTVVWIALLLLVLFTSLVWMSQRTMDSTMRSIEAVRGHFGGEAAELTQADEAFLQLEMTELRRANVRSMLVVITLFTVSLGIHILLQRKHEALEREKMRAEEGSRAKSRFLFNMSHDIRTPMNAIVGFTHLARQPDVPPEKKDEYLEKIEASGEQLLGIINDVLDMSRIENGKMDLIPAPMSLPDAVSEVSDLFRTQMEEKGVTFRTECEALSDPYVLADRNRLNRVLLNLISNAMKFTEKGGTVSVLLRQTGRGKDEGYYELIVRDTGIGMSTEFVQNVFTPFERERTATVSGIQGTGLGLSIAKSIVERMGGKIQVQSEQGKGTEFMVTLSLPVAEAPAAPAREEEGKPTLDFTKMRLLLVEDNAINMEIANMILTQAGFLVDTADDGRAAVEIMRETKPGFYDAILMDIQMPVMNGYEATKAIRALPDPGISSIPIVAMTANVFQEDVQAAKNAGMDAHIGKPLDVEKMLGTLTQVLEHRAKEKETEEREL